MEKDEDYTGRYIVAPKGKGSPSKFKTRGCIWVGVYGAVDLRKFTLEGLMRMRQIHKQDLATYYASSYAERDRDIEETLQNIAVIDEVIRSR